MASGHHKPGYRRPRITEKRRVRQPFKIDRMPSLMRERIKQLRAQGKTWQQISAAVGIPKSSLIRWYAVRVEQPSREIEALALAEVMLQERAKGPTCR
jgi:hypothetical protein